MWSLDYRHHPSSGPASNPLPPPLPKVHSFGYMDYLPDWVFYWHAHDEDTELALITRGTGCLHIGNHQIPLSRGTICMVPVNMLHYFSSDPGERLEYYVLELDTVEDSYPMTPWLTQQVCRVFRAEQNIEHFLFILDMLSNQAAAREYVAGSDLQAATYTLLYWLHNLAGGIREEQYDSSGFALEPALRHIALHFAEPIDTAQLCRIASVSSATLNRQFQQFCGMSPINYLIYYRIAQSLRYLQYTNMPISEAAWRVGYQNHTHYTRLFARYIGCTPAQFRLQLRKKFKEFLDLQREYHAPLSHKSDEKRLAEAGTVPAANFELH